MSMKDQEIRPVSLRASIVMFKARLIRFLGRFRLKFALYHHAVLRNDRLNQLKNDRLFIDVVQITRFLNSIRSSQRAYLRIPDTGSPENNKDRLEQVLRLSAVLYQALEKFNGLEKKLCTLSAWGQYQHEIDYIQHQISNNSSYFKVVIKPIRDKIVNHFDADVIKKALHNLDETKRNVFAVSKRILNKDIVYLLVDNLILDYIDKLLEKVDSSLERYGAFLTYVNDLTQKLTRIANAVIEEFLLNGNAIYERRRMT